MNKKLKTLKNIKMKPDFKLSLFAIDMAISSNDFEDYDISENQLINIQDLRNEAIKWIKELEKTKKIEHIEFGKDGYWFNHKKCEDENGIEKMMLLTRFNPNEVIKWIKYFFDISNEDLK